MSVFYLTALTLLPIAVFGRGLSSYSSKELYSLAENNAVLSIDSSRDNQDVNLLNFYGKVQTSCEFNDCFDAVVATGRTNFIGDGGDLANIYVPPNNYDTWKQYMSAEKELKMSPTEGEFIYHMKNDTLSCLIIELRWVFSPSFNNEQKTSPRYDCVGTPIAMNWDCHLDWALTTECSFNSTTNQVEALYTIVNLGQEKIDGEGQVIVVNQRDNESPSTYVFKK